MIRIPFGSACVGESSYRFSRLEKHRTYSVNLFCIRNVTIFHVPSAALQILDIIVKKVTNFSDHN